MLGIYSIEPIFPASHARAAEVQTTGTLSQETMDLFSAIRAGDLVAVQAAVVNGADLHGIEEKSNMTPDELSKSLKYYSITHFLKIYMAIEDGGETDSQVAQEESESKPAETVTLPEGQYADEAGGILQKLTEADEMANDPEAEVNAQAAAELADQLAPRSPTRQLTIWLMS